MKVICCQRTLPQPSSNYIEIAIDQSRSMPIPSSGLEPSCLLGFYPNVFFSIKYSKATVVLLAIVSTKYKQFLLVKRRGMIFNLRGSSWSWTHYCLRRYNLLILILLGIDLHARLSCLVLSLILVT